MVMPAQAKKEKKRMIRLTQQEADMLIAMLKKKLEEQSELEFPSKGGKLQFKVKGERRTDEFVVNIDRKGIDSKKGTYQGRVKSNNTILMRIDIGDTLVHQQPNGSKLCGSHIHIYNEEYGIKGEAIPFDPGNDDLYAICNTFFQKFNIIEPPIIKQKQQLSLYDLE